MLAGTGPEEKRHSWTHSIANTKLVLISFMPLAAFT
jgi:hypothetical protein